MAVRMAWTIFCMICWCYDDLTLIENALTGQTAARPLFTPCVKRVRDGSFYFKNLFSRHFAGALNAPSCVQAAWLCRGVKGLKCSWAVRSASTSRREGQKTSGLTCVDVLFCWIEFRKKLVLAISSHAEAGAAMVEPPGRRGVERNGRSPIYRLRKIGSSRRPMSQSNPPPNLQP